MTINDSWVYQGRKEHGYFGDGASPKDDTSKDPTGATNQLFAPANAAQRVDYAAHGIIMRVPQGDHTAVGIAVLGALAFMFASRRSYPSAPPDRSTAPSGPSRPTITQAVPPATAPDSSSPKATVSEERRKHILDGDSDGAHPSRASATLGNAIHHRSK